MFRLAVTSLFRPKPRLTDAAPADAPGKDERRTGERLSAALRQHEIDGETSIALGQAGICCFVLLLHLISQVGTAWQSFNMWVLVALAVLIATSALRYIAAGLSDLSGRLFDILTVIDLAAFLSLIWSYQYAYDHPAGSVLKAPSLTLVFVLIAMRALKSSPRAILIAGGTSVLGWCAFILSATLKGGPDAVTRDYDAFISAGAIVIGAEVEKIFALAALTLLLAVAARKSREALSQAADATFFAEALDTAEKNLTEAQSARKTAEQALAALDRRDADLACRNDRFHLALETMSQGLCMFDKDKNLLVCNERYIDIYGLAPELAKPGTPFRKIIEHRIQGGVFCGNDPEAYIRERLTAVEEQNASTKLHELTDGRVIAISHRPMPDGGWLATHEDITELQRAQAKLQHMANHDALTDLPNRGLLREKIEENLRHARRGRGFALLCVGLDRFKSVNDTLGHRIGDELLKAVALRLAAAVRDTDVIARLGGDEFAILQQAGEQPHMATLLAARLTEVVKLPYEIEGNAVVIGGSIGIAIGPHDGDDADKLLKNADMALYKAKSDGRGVYRFYEPEMDARMKERRALELDLRDGLKKGQFDLHYQPILNLSTREISGCEALLRWTHPDRGVVPACEFIPLAEEIGLIDDIGALVIERACRDAAKWPHRVRVAVNLSPTQFKNHDLVRTIVNALSKSRLAAIRLEIEITESVLLEDNENTLKTLYKLRGLGIRIAMDDFGTGYSSLSYLRSFPFDKIKIDQSFVRDLSGNAEAAAIIRSVTSLADCLGMITTAEGVETAEQLRQVHREGCTEIQGYICSPPRPAAEITAMLSGRSAPMQQPDALSA